MIGETISHYRIVEKLGEGGMGVVYEAEDLMLHRPVALKVLPAEAVADGARRDRFVQEARAASAINHPHIAQVHELGEHEGRHFIAMELIRGPTLRQLARDKKLPLDRLLELMIQVTDALAKAHRQGIIHRDLKPENVMINEDGQAKVLDFGLAKLFEGTLASSVATRDLSGMTRPGVLVGTPHYMSPEQAQGKPADRRSDTFSVGVMMYELATGRRPFQGESLLEVMQAIVSREPQPLSEIDATLPLEFQWIVQKSMAKRREDRYQDIKDLCVDLRQLRRELESGSAPRISDVRHCEHKARPWSRRALWASVSVLVLVALIVGIYTILQPRRSPDPSGRPSVAVYWFENLSDSEEQNYFVAGMTEELINELWKMGGLKVNTWDDIRPLRDETLTARQVGERLGYDYVLTGTIRRAADQIRVTPRLVDVSAGSQVWTARFDDVVDNVFALQDSIALEIASQLRVHLTSDERRKVTAQPTGSQEAYDHYLKGRYFHDRATFEDNERAVKEYQKALRIDPDYPLALAGLADAYVQRYKERYDYDEHWLDEADRLIEETLQLESDLAEAYESRSEVLFEKESYLGALEAAQRARDLRPDWDEPYLRLGEIYHERGERGLALEAFDRALAIRPSVDGLCGRGKAFEYLGLVDSTEVAYRAAARLNPAHDRPFYHLGFLYYYSLNDLEEAERMLRRAIEVRPDRGRSYDLLKDLLCYGRGRFQDAEELIRGFADRYPYHYDAYSALFNFLAYDRGDYPAAVAVAEEAAARNPERVWPHLILAEAHAAQMGSIAEPEKVTAAIQKAKKLRPGSARVLRVIGDIYSGSPSDAEKALEHYRLALKASPGSPKVLSYMTYFLLGQAMFDSAAVVAAEYVEQTPGRSGPYWLLEIALTHLMRSEEYLQIIQDAAAKYGRENPWLRVYLGKEQRLSGNYQKAMESYRRVLAMREGGSTIDLDLIQESLKGLGIAQWLSGDTDGALASFCEAAETESEGSYTLHDMMVIPLLKYLGRFDEIEARLEKLHDDGMIDSWVYHANRYYPTMRSYDKAISAVEEALESDDVTYKEYLILQTATWHRQKGDPSTAEKILSDIGPSLPRNYRELVHMEIAAIGAMRGDLERAVQLVQRAHEETVDIGQRNGQLMLLSKLHYAQGRTEDAVNVLAEANGFSGSIGAFYRRAQLAAVTGSPKAEDELKRALLLATRGSRSDVWWYGLGKARVCAALAFARLGDPEAARSEIEFAVRLEPELAEIAYGAACAYSLVGDTERALDWLQTTVERGHQELWWARVDPDLDNLRDLARFEDIMSDWDSRMRAIAL